MFHLYYQKTNILLLIFYKLSYMYKSELTVVVASLFEYSDYNYFIEQVKKKIVVIGKL